MTYFTLGMSRYEGLKTENVADFNLTFSQHGKLKMFWDYVTEGIDRLLAEMYKGTAMESVYIVLLIVFGVASIASTAEVFKKAGYNPWLSLLIIVPGINLIAWFWFAFSKWPILSMFSKEREIQRLKEKKEKLENAISSMAGSAADIPISLDKEMGQTEKEDAKLQILLRQAQSETKKLEKQHQETKSDVLKCFRCGKETGDIMKFCPWCSAKLRVDEPQIVTTSTDNGDVSMSRNDWIMLALVLLVISCFVALVALFGN